MMDFNPFKNESDALTVGDLKIENGEDRIAVYGTLALTRDRAGLAAAKVLQAVFQKIAAELEAGPELPVRVAAAEIPAKVNNPFA
jgi:hypothetical protein